MIAAISLSSLSTNGGLTLLPYANAQEDTAANGQRILMISTTDDKGNVLHMWTLIKNAYDGTVVFSGFSPIEFRAEPREFYKVSLSNYGNYYFDHWSDDNMLAAPACNCDLPDAGLGIPFRYIPDDGNSYTLSAVYRTTPFPEGKTPLTILSKNAIDGSDLPGMYLMIFKEFTYTNPNTGEQAKRAVVDATGWTSYSYGMDSDKGYLVEAIDYVANPADLHSKGLVFDHWADGGTGFIKELPAGSPATNLIAYYKPVDDACPSCT